MALRLPRFLRSSPLVEANGTPTLTFHQWWDTVLKQIEASITRIELALAAAGVALDGVGTGGGTSLELDGGDAAGSDGSIEIDGGGA